ncbi:hypothetical protein C8R45DRAFT_1149297 [Mycena sanguinolenta]|nr:hypothetical protein C8R45DRAFT_1149297 [Mycena sanguinolenta]
MKRERRTAQSTAIPSHPLVFPSSRVVAAKRALTSDASSRGRAQKTHRCSVARDSAKDVERKHDAVSRHERRRRSRKSYEELGAGARYIGCDPHAAHFEKSQAYLQSTSIGTKKDRFMFKPRARAVFTSRTRFPGAAQDPANGTFSRLTYSHAKPQTPNPHARRSVLEWEDIGELLAALAALPLVPHKGVNVQRPTPHLNPAGAARNTTSSISSLHLFEDDHTVRGTST